MNLNKSGNRSGMNSVLMQRRAAEAQAALAERELARRRLLFFTQKFRPRYKAGWVHKVICHKLEKFSNDVEAEKSPRLMFLMPPRHGKSTLASEMFPAWHLGRFPNHELIAASYNVSLPTGFSRKVRALIREPLYQKIFVDAQLDPDSQSAEAWLTTAGGGYIAAGVGGGITGKGAHVLCIDDPIKDAKEADSLTIRDDLWDWYGSTAYSRLSPGGGVVLIQCLVGDTMVLLPDGSERRLDNLRAGDEVATYEDGRLASTTIAAWKSSGRDLVYKITMSSGRIVRANGRHPFLVSDNKGLKWVRTRNLTTASRIVTVRGSGGSGEGNPALSRDAGSQRNAVATAHRTTERNEWPTDTAHRLTTLFRSALATLSTAMASLKGTTSASLLRRMGNALSAVAWRSQSIGATVCASITATRLVEFAGCSATTATLRPDISALKKTPLLWLGTSDFTTDRVISVEPAGEEEVFDVQIARTENFIANGAVSHNTWWNEDDLAGRLQLHMLEDEEFDQFEIVKFPAIAEEDEFLDDDYNIYRASEGDIPAGAQLVRVKGEPLHPERYTLPMLRRIEKTLTRRHWTALYQQNPVPDEGLYFTRDQFLPVVDLPGNKSRARGYVYQSVDFAITDQTRSDFTVIATVEQDFEDNVEAKDCVRGKWTDGDTIVEKMLDSYEKWTPDRVGVEDGMIWKAISATFWKRARERNLAPNVELLKPGGKDKGTRAVPLQVLMQRGRMRWPKNAPWYDALEREFLRFLAGGNHDDQVDAFAWCAFMVANSGTPPIPKSDKKPSWRDRLPMLINGMRPTGHMSA